MPRQSYIVQENYELPAHPTTPAFQYSTIYPRNDGKWYTKRWDGTITEIMNVAGVVMGQTEVDFGVTPVVQGTFTITEATATATSKIVATLAYEAPTGKDLDELEMDDLIIKCGPAGVGSFTMFITAADGSYLADKFKINYSIF